MGIRSLLVVMAVHWLDNLIPELYVKYRNARKAITTAVGLSLLSPVVFWDVTEGFIKYLRDAFSPSGLLWGIVIGVAMLVAVYAGVMWVKRKNGR